MQFYHNSQQSVSKKIENFSQKLSIKMKMIFAFKYIKMSNISIELMEYFKYFKDLLLLFFTSILNFTF